MKFIKEPFVVVDVETTGGSPGRHRITEIACIRFENGLEVDRLVSLINPERPVPLTIQYLTGITDAMLTDAPVFEDVAERVEEIFEGAVLVAHNARFDYSFIKAEMGRLGKKFTLKMLCTARLSRKVFSEHARHNLSTIIERHEILCSARHRALGDAEVLCHFLRLLEKERPVEAKKASLEIMKRSYVPKELDDALIAELPDSPGIYYLYDAERALLYIGKSVNIRTRVISHFHATHTTGSDMRLWQETKHIETRVTGSDLGASLLELDQIKTLSPLYNRRSRRARGLWYLVKKPGSYFSFVLEKTVSVTELEEENVYAVFKDKHQAKKMLGHLMEEHRFCPKTFGLEKGTGPCFPYQLGTCSGACVGNVKAKQYNALLEMVFVRRKVKLWPFSGPILLMCSRDGARKDFFLIDHWRLQKACVSTEEGLEPLFPLSKPLFDYEVYRLLSKEMVKPSLGTAIFSHTTPEYKSFLDASNV